MSIILECLRLDLRQLRHRDHWVGRLQQLPPLCLVVVGAGVCLRVSVLGAESHLALAAVAIRDVDLLATVRLCTPRLRGLLSLRPAERSCGERWSHETRGGPWRRSLPRMAFWRCEDCWNPTRRCSSILPSAKFPTS